MRMFRVYPIAILMRAASSTPRCPAAPTHTHPTVVPTIVIITDIAAARLCSDLKVGMIKRAVVGADKPPRVALDLDGPVIV